MSKAKTETVEVTKGFLEYRESELRKSRERLRAARAKLREAEEERRRLDAHVERLLRENARMDAALRRRAGRRAEETAAPKVTTPKATKFAAGAAQDARLSIETVYKVSRERALALTKLDECEMWLGRCEPKETAAPTLEGAAQDAAMPCLKDDGAHGFAMPDVSVEINAEKVAETVAKSLRESVQPALRMAVR